MKGKFDAIIFDMDGVLVTNSSYCLAIKKTVERTLLSSLGIKIKVNDQDIYALKKITGFNNDWDVSFALIGLLGQKTTAEKFGERVKKITGNVRETNNYKYIKEIFQAFYLGERIYRFVYKNNPPFKFRPGLIERENLLIEIKLLRKLSGNFQLGIATSRPRYEALFTANNLQVAPQFIKEEFIVAKEDALKEKPDPAPLVEAVKRIKAKNPIYIGDTINDVIAAQKAGMPCIFIGNKKLGDYQFTNVNQIQEIFL